MREILANANTLLGLTSIVVIRYRGNSVEGVAAGVLEVTGFLGCVGADVVKAVCSSVTTSVVAPAAMLIY